MDKIEMKLLGLDYGSKTVGVSVTDDLGLMAHSLETIFRERKTKLRQTLHRIEEICEDLKVEKIILGYPLNMDGSVGERAKKTIMFKEKLEKRINIPVILWDERCTTLEADEILSESNVKKIERKKYVDKIAATIILEDYLNNQKN